MAKNSISDYDTTAANNTDIQSTDISEGCAASGINNALREIMADTADAFTQGTPIALDQTNNRVGIGTVSPSTSLDVVRNGVQPLRVESTSGTEVAINMVNTGGNVQLEAHSGNFNIDADAVGIGKDSPSTLLHLSDTEASGGVTLTLENIGDGGVSTTPFVSVDAKLNSIRNAGSIRFGRDSNYGSAADSDSHMAFYTALNDTNTERMRIDSSGNVLVAKTALDNSTVGARFNATGDASFVCNGNRPLVLNRKTSDGDLIIFLQDGSTVGGIGTQGGDLNIGTGNTGIYFEDGGNRIRPWDFGNNSSRDNAIDLGLSSARFNDAFITNGVTTGSDQNEKQQIASLTTAEMTAAKAISKLFKTFKWNDAVAAKGDAARTHTGVIAQEVQTAMTDAGLDAADYAFWCSDTWWETSTDVPAVAAADAVLDDDGNVITEAVEAQDAYTRIDTYDTADDAPEGATQRTRLGIRYPELLAFVGAATEQRLADIETRLTALENA